jgi:nitrite reductase/ring-hydroxylating ferredoxin subunit
VGGVVGLGVGVPLVAACGGGDEGGDAGGSGGTGTTASGAIGKASEVPVGGGKIFAGDKVVTQPTEGDFKAFSAVCTHQGCVVAEIKGENIDCTCHGSQFSIVDGSNTRGPNDTPAGSVKPLPELKVTVKGGEISVA